MSLSIEESRVRYVGTGLLSTYAYTFPVTLDTHIVVDYADDNDENDATLVLNTDYTVDLVAQTITLLGAYAPLPAGHQMSIRREVPFKQLFEVDHDGPYNPADFEGTWDRSMEAIQWLVEEVRRCAKTDVWSDETGDDLIAWIEAALAAAQAAQAAAEAAQAAAEAAQTAAEDARDLAEDWATLMALVVDGGTEYSSKEYAIGTTDAHGGSSKGWAVTPEDTVVPGGGGSAYSSLHHSAKAAIAQAAAEAAQAAAEAARDAALAATGLPVTQVAHGFVQLDPIRYDKASGLWVKAVADSLANTATHVVQAKTSDDIFVPADGGFIVTTAPHGLTLGDKYYLSQTVAGAYTNTPPVLGEVAVRQPIFKVVSTDEVAIIVHENSIYDQKKEVKEVTQLGHGLVKGKPVRFDDTTGDWVLAQADVDANKATHIVLEGTTTDVLFLGETGIHTWTGHTLNVGSVYYVSPTVAGDLVEGEPATGEPNPVVFVMDANTVLLKLLAVGGGGGTAEQTTMKLLGTPTYDDVQDWANQTQAACILSGAIITDGGAGTIDISAATGIIKASDNDIGENLHFDIGAVTGLTLTDNATNKIYVDYNAGTPQYAASTGSVDGNSQICIGQVFREGTVVHIVNDCERLERFGYKVNHMLREVFGYRRAYGLVIGETGTRNVTMTAGEVYIATTEIVIGAIDTSAADDFTAIYRDGAGGWTQVASQTQIDNLNYDDGSGTLAALSGPRYGVHWVYLDHEGDMYIQYGQGNYTLTQAENALVPPTYALLSDFALLVGKIIVGQGAASFTDIISAFDVSLTGTPVSNHNDLGNIQGGAADEYYHLSAAQLAAVLPTIVDLEDAKTFEVDGVAPSIENVGGVDHWILPNGGTREVWGYIKVPSTHITGTQIKLGVVAHSDSATNTWLLTATGYLIRTEEDAIDDVTNSRASTNTAVTNTLAKMARRILMDITDASGQVNGVDAEAGDLIRFKIVRGVGTDTGDVKVIKG